MGKKFVPETIFSESLYYQGNKDFLNDLIRKILVAKLTDEVLKNAESLLDSANILMDNGKKLHAGHFAAICLEECSKCLMNIEEIRSFFGTESLLSHFKKEELVIVFHYLAGKLSMIYLIKHASGKKLLGGTKEDQDIVLNDLLEKSGMKGTNSLAENIHQFLEFSKKKGINKKPIYKNNENKKKYCLCGY